MRRPLKPFVTEYKQSNRRGPAPSSEQSPSESERPPPRLFDLASNESEDSYDAAMRAADALFSIPSPRVHSTDSDRPAQTQPMSAERQALNVERTPLPVAGASEKPGGRILRVLDESPNPQMLALEAEHAPKRRGRKPGSKNKPKAAIIALESQPAMTALASMATPREAASLAPSVQATRQAPTLPAATASLAAVPVAAITMSKAAPRVPALRDDQTPRGDKKFPWVRDRLRPGEDWKRRRLPRVCW